MRRSGGRTTIGLIMRGAAVLCLLLALVDLKLPMYHNRPAIAFLLDISESVGKIEDGLRELRKYVRSLPKGSKWCLIVFARYPSLEIPLTEEKDLAPDRIVSTIDRGRTDIESAIKLALSVLPSDMPRRIVILSDGNQNLNDASSLIPLLRAERAEVYAVPIYRHLGGEVLLDPNERHPRSVRIGAPIELVAIARSLSKAKGRITVYRNGEIIKHLNLSIKSGINPIRVVDRIEGEGNYEYRFHLEAEPDTIPNNNDAYAWISVKGRPSLLFVGDRKEGGYFLDLARKNGILGEIQQPNHFPDDVSKLANKDVIIIGNLPSNAFNEAQMEAIRLFANQIGGGVLILGGDRAFGAGGYFNTPIEKLSPVNMDPRGKEQRMALVALVDKSGSMANYVGTDRKIDLAEAALESAIRSLRGDDLFGCIAFDAKPRIVFPLGRVEDREALIKKARSISPGSGTNLYAALKLAYNWLRRVDLPFRHVIAVTDGRSQGNFPPLVRRMAANGITISAIAVGDEARGILTEIARDGKGRYYDLDDLSQLPNVFVREIHSTRDLIVEGRFTPILKMKHPIISGIGSLPPLDGYVATSEKGAAQVILASDRGDPILSVWRYGLGKVAAFTSQIGGKWGKEWARWKEGSKFWLQLIRWLMPQRERSELNLSIENGRGVARIEMIDKRGYPVTGLVLQARVIGPDSDVQTIPMEEISAGRYEAKFNLLSLGRYAVSIVIPKARGNELLVASGSLYLPYSPEYSNLTINASLLRRLAAGTGGVYQADPEIVGKPVRSPHRSLRPIWRWLILASVILVMLELIMRKVKIRSAPSPSSPKPADIPPEGDEEDRYIERLLKIRSYSHRV
ncbi:VWA domain-containing protein [Candidatus Poribacteria bacterium]|nr:VWA domain-containing protein [Candidatus Poribacteria bacterium]